MESVKALLIWRSTSVRLVYRDRLCFMQQFFFGAFFSVLVVKLVCVVQGIVHSLILCVCVCGLVNEYIRTICMYVCICMYKCVCVCIHTYIHTYIHTKTERDSDLNPLRWVGPTDPYEVTLVPPTYTNTFTIEGLKGSMTLSGLKMNLQKMTVKSCPCC